SCGSRKSTVTNQTFSYLIVIDFESTCWREKNNYGQEIIEFPAVLLNTSTGEVESEFHTYVQPQEHPFLSEFCTELTGITQMQVEAGIPLQICLSRFGRWLQSLKLEKGVVFSDRQQKSSAPSPSQKLCAFVTWSDWDLGVCLQYECKRKQLYKPDMLNSWIDLRSTYRLFYDRKPKGLNGALQDLGIQFSGREHSGLDDSRNTAQLAARMMRDGCVMKITRSLVKVSTQLKVKPLFGNTTADNKKEENSNREENTHNTNKPSSCKIPQKLCDIKQGLEKVTKDKDRKENTSPVRQSLISPKTLLNETTTTVWGRSRRSIAAQATSTPYTSFAKPKPVITKPAKHKVTPKSSFNIYTDQEKRSSSSMYGSKNVLSSLLTNTLSSRANQSSITGPLKERQKITSPLCACGRRAKRQVVSNGGPNQGRGFYCCPVRRSGSGGRIQKGCEFFKWESALMKSSSVSPAAFRTHFAASTTRMQIISQNYKTMCKQTIRQ
uniref:ERI1 exoribonuclease 2 n=1 Tax=Labrus bergylta TaxID=56723 RepID=A0A3Q3EXM3_9LABR